eukprot:sb/3464969/
MFICSFPPETYLSIAVLCRQCHVPILILFLVPKYQEPTETSQQPIRTRYLGHVTGYQPISDQYFLIRSVPAKYIYILKPYQRNTGRQKTQNITSSLSLSLGPLHAPLPHGAVKPRVGAGTRYLGHVTGYQPIRDQYFLIRSVPAAQQVDSLISVKGAQIIDNVPNLISFQEPTDTSKQPIRTRYLGHVTGYQPIRDQYFLIRSVPVSFLISSYILSHKQTNGVTKAISDTCSYYCTSIDNMTRPKQVNNQSELAIKSRDWLSANQGPVFPDSVGSCNIIIMYAYLVQKKTNNIPAVKIQTLSQFLLPMVVRSSSPHFQKLETVIFDTGTDQTTNQNSLFRSRDWLSANQGPDFLIRSTPPPPAPAATLVGLLLRICCHVTSFPQIKQPIRTRYLDHVTRYQPIRGQYFLIFDSPITRRSMVGGRG